MARGRMIDNCISISEKINDLSLKEAFIYTWIIPHLDDWGRISGSPRTIKALVFPMKKEISISNIENAIRRFNIIGLFQWDEVNGELVLQQPFEEFSSHQSISEGKRAKSKYPEILSTNLESPRIPKNPQESPAQVSISKENLIKENVSTFGIDVLQETSTPSITENPDPDKEPEKPKPKKQSDDRNKRITFNRTPDIKDAKFVGITEGDIDVWVEAYPAVNFTVEVKKAIAWIYGAGPQGYKSKWYTFLNGWFNRTQNSGGTK